MPFLISILLTIFLQNSYLLVPAENELLSTVVYMGALHLQIAVWVITLAVTLPYKQLLPKCFLMIYGLHEVFLALEVTLLTIKDFPIFIMLAIVFTSWLMFVFMRSYKLPNDKIDLDHFFYFRHKPDSIQDFILALFGSPTGGNAIYQNGYVYHFHRGELKRTEYSKFNQAMRSKWQIKKGEALDIAKVRRLELTVGSHWAWNHNCQTILYPIAKWGHPLTIEGATQILAEYMRGSK